MCASTVGAGLQNERRVSIVLRSHHPLGGVASTAFAGEQMHCRLPFRGGFIFPSGEGEAYTRRAPLFWR
jgi:hypothetical protein